MVWCVAQEERSVQIRLRLFGLQPVSDEERHGHDFMRSRIAPEQQKRAMNSGCLAVSLLLLTLGVVSVSHAQSPNTNPRRELHYFIVDWSGSMNGVAQGTSGLTRWEVAKEALKGWVTQLPDSNDNDVRVLMFNSRVPAESKSQQSRGAKLQPIPVLRLGHLGPEGREDRLNAFLAEHDKPDGGTALWNALGACMEQVRTESEQFDFVWVYLFSDGDDQNSEKVKGSPYTFDFGTKGRAQSLEAWRKLIKDRPHTHMIVTNLGSDIREPLNPSATDQIWLSRPEFRANLRCRADINSENHGALAEFVGKEQRPTKQLLNVRVQMDGPDVDIAAKGAVIPVEFVVSDAGRKDGVRVKLKQASIPMATGTYQVEATLAAGDGSHIISGHLVLRIPAIDKADVVVAQSVEKPPVIRFAVNFAAAPPRAADTDAAEDNAKAAAKAAADKIAAEEAKAIAIERARPPAQVGIAMRTADPTFSGSAVAFEASFNNCRPTQQLAWFVNDGDVSKDGDSGTSCVHVFSVPGTHVVRVQAVTDRGTVASEPLTVVVEQGLSLVLEAVPTELNMEPGASYSFVAKAKGPTPSFTGKRVAWTLRRKDGTELQASKPALETFEELKEDGKSIWQCQLPALNAPADVVVEARMVLDGAERGRWEQSATEATADVRLLPPGLFVQLVLPLPGTEVILLGLEEMFEAEWTGSRADQVTKIVWVASCDGKVIARNTSVMGAPGEPRIARNLLAAMKGAEYFGKKVEMIAVPYYGTTEGPADSHAKWTLTCSIPKLWFEIKATGLDAGVLRFPNELSLSLHEQSGRSEFVDSVSWDWGDSSEPTTIRGDAALRAERSYPLKASGIKHVKATVTLFDKSAVVCLYDLEHRTPEYRIEKLDATKPRVRVGQRATFKVSVYGETQYDMRYVRVVNWGCEGQPAKVGAAQYDVEWPNAQGTTLGPKVMRAGLRVGRDEKTEELVSLEEKVEIYASDQVRLEEHNLEGGTAAGAVNFTLKIEADDDYMKLETVVSRVDTDGKLHQLQTLYGPREAFRIAEKDFGDYSLEFFAHRLPTQANTNTRVPLGKQMRTYKDQNWALAIAVFIVSMVIFGLFSRCVLLYQAPRRWSLKLSRKDPNDGNMIDAAPTTWRLADPKWGFEKWSWCKYTKHMDIEARAMAAYLEKGDDGGPGLSWLSGQQRALRIQPGGWQLVDPARTEWDPPTPHRESRQRIYQQIPDSEDPIDQPMFVWLDAPPRASYGKLWTLLLMVAVFAGNFWFMQEYCKVF